MVLFLTALFIEETPLNSNCMEDTELGREHVRGMGMLREKVKYGQGGYGAYGLGEEIQYIYKHYIDVTNTITVEGKLHVELGISSGS